MTDTTGQYAITIAEMGSRVQLGHDLGWYEGTLEELNIRRVAAEETLDLGLTDPAVQQVLAAVEPYGGTWAGGKLYPITEAQAEELRQAAADRAEAARAAKQAYRLTPAQIEANRRTHETLYRDYA